MPRPKSEPLSLEQQAIIYDDYTCPAGPPIPMTKLAKKYQVSVSVIHRAIHNEGFRRAKEGTSP